MNLEIFEHMEKYRFEQLVLCHDQTSGLRAIIAIHNTSLGPALGGTRMWTYKTEDEAILDALRLARGMTYKSAAAGLNLGGGKAVIMGDPRKDKSEQLFRAFGRYVESLGGRYITAEDVGTSVQDMEFINMETKHVTGVSADFKSSGDPSPATAFGVWQGMKAAAREVYGDSSLTGKTIAVQGLGHVGGYLLKHLAEEGAKLIVTDIFADRVKTVVDELGATAVDPKDIYGVECDIFAPCALGAVVNDETLPRFKCKIIAGAANNVLQEERHGDLLEQKGILYTPDFVINAGGIINIADELQGYNRERAFQRVAGIYENVQKVFTIAKRDKIPTYKAAEVMAEERLNKIARISIGSGVQ
ncbi:MAG: Glu/Leu/Phe/Val dehydrogenase [Clostridia bacterium]|nr:Glu/Leu/Phe/Val dehydrogenase [Clostridia bacterium]